MDIKNEIISKTVYILNNLEFNATEELLQNIDRLIEYWQPKSELDQFIESVNNQLANNTSYSNDFLIDIFDMPLEEGVILFSTYLKYKNKLK